MTFADLYGTIEELICDYFATRYDKVTALNVDERMDLQDTYFSLFQLMKAIKLKNSTVLIQQDIHVSDGRIVAIGDDAFEITSDANENNQDME